MELLNNWISNDPIFDLKDIFFTKQYHQLFTVSGEVEVYSFVFKENEEIFLFPYLKCKIPNTEYFDFETPYGYGGPISSSNSTEFLKRANQKFFESCKDLNIIAGFIRFHPFINNHILIDDSTVDIVDNSEIVIMDLRDLNIDSVWSNYRKNVRNKIRLAEKNNVEVYSDNSLKSINDFASLYHLTMDRVGANSFYKFDASFFSKLAEFGEGCTFLFSRHEDEIVGACVLLISGKYMTYYLSATNDIGMKLGVSNLLRHESIKLALDRGIRYINFGGGYSSDPNDSLLKYKKGFSNSTLNFKIGKLILNKQVYSEVCEKWMGKANRETIEKFGNRVLKYRY